MGDTFLTIDWNTEIPYATLGSGTWIVTDDNGDNLAQALVAVGGNTLGVDFQVELSNPTVLQCVDLGTIWFRHATDPEVPFTSPIPYP